MQMLARKHSQCAGGKGITKVSGPHHLGTMNVFDKKRKTVGLTVA